jgi:SAM-dependent methyltransferase
LTSSSDKEWERIGRKEPFYGVWTDESFLTALRDDQAEERFWLSGERHIQSVFHFVWAHLKPNFSPRNALDFGCGVGRITIPMAEKCVEVLGVDVSTSMLDVAQKQLTEKSIGNVSLAHSSDGLFPGPDRFDFIHSYIVFQHIAPSQGYRILDQLLARLASGGIGVVHFSFDNYKRSIWLRRLHQLPVGKQIGNCLRGKRLSEPVMQMNEYDMNHVMSRIKSIADGEVHIEFTDHGVLGAILYFKKADFGKLA